MPADGPQPELLLGAATPAEARVFVRLPRAAQGEERLTGYVHGPICDYARTLPARIPLVDSGRGDSPLWAAIVPDPCFWTPALPMRYEAVVEAEGESHVLPFGIRALYRRGRRLVLDGQVWKLRAVSAETSAGATLADWRTEGAAMLVSNPDEELCHEADRRGVLLVADLAGLLQDESLLELRRLSRHPCVGFAILPAGKPFGSDPRPLAAGALLCQCIDPSAAEPPVAIQPWADLALVRAEDVIAAAAFAAGCPLPAIAYRPLAETTDIAAARRGCDVLQADLAGRADFVGYVV